MIAVEDVEIGLEYIVEGRYSVAKLYFENVIREELKLKGAKEQ